MGWLFSDLGLRKEGDKGSPLAIWSCTQPGRQLEFLRQWHLSRCAGWLGAGCAQTQSQWGKIGVWAYAWPSGGDDREGTLLRCHGMGPPLALVSAESRPSCYHLSRLNQGLEVTGSRLRGWPTWLAHPSDVQTCFVMIYVPNNLLCESQYLIQVEQSCSGEGEVELRSLSLPYPSGPQPLDHCQGLPWPHRA